MSRELAAGLGHGQAEQLCSFQPLAGDRFNIDIWFAKGQDETFQETGHGGCRHLDSGSY